MNIHEFVRFWLIGSILVAFDVLYVLKNNENVKFKYNRLTTLQKLGVFWQLLLICVFGSWFIIIWRVITFLFIRRIK